MPVKRNLNQSKVDHFKQMHGADMIYDIPTCHVKNSQNYVLLSLDRNVNIDVTKGIVIGGETFRAVSGIRFANKNGSLDKIETMLFMLRL